MSFTSRVNRNHRYQIHWHHEFEPIPLLDGSLNGTGHRVRKYTDRESRSDVAHVDPSLRRRMSFTSRVNRNHRYQIHWQHEFEPIPLFDGSLNGTGHRVGKYTDRESRSDVAYVSNNPLMT